MGITRLKSPEAAARWLQEWCTGQLRSDSRAVQKGDAFIAWPGHQRDGRAFVAQALAAGAATCLVEAEGVDAFDFHDGRVAALPGLKAATGAIAAAVLGEPTRQLEVLAVTGTNGKTSSAWWLAQALTRAGRRCGLVGTLGVGEPGALDYTGLTTPDPVRLQQGFAAMRDAGFAACAIEASSIGLVEQRLAGTRIAVALFTNFTQDHLDYHGDMAAYWAAKRSLFDWPGLRAAVVNIDDVTGAQLAAELQGQGVWGAEHRAGVASGPAQARSDDAVDSCPQGGATTHAPEPDATLRAEPQGRQASLPAPDVARHAASPAPSLSPLGPRRQPCALSPRPLDLWTVGLGAGARLRASAIAHGADGLRFTVHEGADAIEVQTGLIGDYNVLNWLGVLGGLRALGVPLAEAAAAAAAVTPVPGRMQRIGHGRELPQLVVDYAHTPDALDKALGALKPLAAARGGKLWVLFGCGGDRDRTKRPLMGAAAARAADHLVLTSDNPRSEDPAQILADIAAGVPSAHEQIADRAQAIRHAVLSAAREDVIVLAGKGHEDYQEIAGVRHPFDDAVQARAALIERAGL